MEGVRHLSANEFSTLNYTHTHTRSPAPKDSHDPLSSLTLDTAKQRIRDLEQCLALMQDLLTPQQKAQYNAIADMYGRARA